MAPQVGFEWHIGEEEFERFGAGWNAEETQATFSDKEHAITLVLLRTVAALVVMAVAAASAAFSPAQVQLLETEKELTALLALEQQAWTDRDPSTYEALIDPQVDSEWIGQWRGGWGTRSSLASGRSVTLLSAAHLSEDFVRASVRLVQPRTTNWWQTPVQRETRFYRRAGYTWLRTVPPPSYWGAPLTMQTPHLTFQYFASDAPAVAEAAARLETAYVDLYAMLGLTPPIADEKIVVVVKPEMVLYSTWTSGDLAVTSPQMMPVAEGWTDADHVASMALGRIILRALNSERFVRLIEPTHWGLVISVLRNWLRAELLGQPSAWRTEAQQVFEEQFAAAYPLRLRDLTEFEVEGQHGRYTALWRFMAAETILEYIVDAYGREALPAFLHGMSESDSWAELTLNAFGVPVDEFVAGWNLYLSETYGPE